MCLRAETRHSARRLAAIAERWAWSTFPSGPRPPDRSTSVARAFAARSSGLPADAFPEPAAYWSIMRVRPVDRLLDGRGVIPPKGGHNHGQRRSVGRAEGTKVATLDRPVAGQRADRASFLCSPRPGYLSFHHWRRLQRRAVEKTAFLERLMHNPFRPPPCASRAGGEHFTGHASARPSRSVPLPHSADTEPPRRRRAERAGHGSITSGLPRKSRTCGRADGTLFDCFLDCGKDWARQQVTCLRRAKVADPALGGWERVFR